MDYFPLSLATGKAFCNRRKEVQDLRYNFLESRPTLIVSPRRYGKTSLAIHTLQQSKLNYLHCDFLAAVSEIDIEKIILKSVGQLIGQIESTPKKLLKTATDLFAGLSIKLSLDQVGLSVEINKKATDVAASILGILERVEKISEKYDKKIVLLFDEFQHLYEVTKNQSIESVIRQIAQASKKLSFVFSGSNRHLLYQIFDDRNRPFYKLCDRITLDRIQSEDYIPYLQHASKEEWNHPLELNIIEKIFELTERHPYYMNLLCSRLWKLDKVTASVVQEVWQQYIYEERSQVAMELDLLSNNQRKLLITLARCNGTDVPRSHEFQILAGMAGATIAQALKFLEQKDYVYQDSYKHYRLLDPMFKAVLSDS